MAESKTVSIAVAATVTSILVASVLFSTTKRKRKDITKSILIKSAPVAAAEELAASGSSTCERLLDGRQLVISSNARVADYIFNGRSKDNYVRRPAVDDGLQALGMFQSGLIWNNDLPVWKKIRSCFRKSLNDATLHRAVTVAEEECQVLLQESIHASSETALALNLLSLSRKVTFRVTLNVFFGIPSSAFASLKIHEDAFIESIVAYFKAWEYFLLRPVGKWDSATAEDHEQAVANLNVHFPGMPIEKGAAVLVHLAEMNLRDEYWEDPYIFNPRRFTTGGYTSKASRTKTKTFFFPFGEGPKGCIGMHLGRREVGAIIETVVLHYDIAIQGDVTLDSLETHWDIANQPDNPPLILVSRRTSSSA